MFCTLSAIAAEAPKKDIFTMAVDEAAKGGASPQGHLGHLYLLTSSPEAEKWLRKAAEQGNVDAQIDLAVLYANGQGVKQDWIEAYFWYSVAVNQRDMISNHYITDDWVVGRDNAAKHLNPEQRKAVDMRLKEWTPKEDQQQAAQHLAFCNKTLNDYAVKIGDTGLVTKAVNCIDQCMAQLRNAYPRTEAAPACPEKYWQTIAPPPVVPH